MQHAFALCKDTVILTNHLPKEFISLSSLPLGTPINTLENMEVNAIRQTLLITQGNKSLTARKLGIDPSTLYRKIKRYQLDV